MLPLTTFEDRLRSSLLRANLSATRFAELAGYDRGYVGAVLKGRRDPKLSFIINAAQVLNVPAPWLAFGD